MRSLCRMAEVLHKPATETIRDQSTLFAALAKSAAFNEGALPHEGSFKLLTSSLGKLREPQHLEVASHSRTLKDQSCQRQTRRARLKDLHHTTAPTSLPRIRIRLLHKVHHNGPNLVSHTSNTCSENLPQHTTLSKNARIKTATSIMGPFRTLSIPQSTRLFTSASQPISRTTSSAIGFEANC